MWLLNFAKTIYILCGARRIYWSIDVFFWRGRSRIGAMLFQWFCSISLNFCVSWYRNPSLMGQLNITRSTETQELLDFLWFLEKTLLDKHENLNWIGLWSNKPCSLSRILPTAAVIKTNPFFAIAYLPFNSIVWMKLLFPFQFLCICICIRSKDPQQCVCVFVVVFVCPLPPCAPSRAATLIVRGVSPFPLRTKLHRRTSYFAQKAFRQICFGVQRK